MTFEIANAMDIELQKAKKQIHGALEKKKQKYSSGEIVYYKINPS